LIAGMTTGAFLVTDGGVTKCGVGGTQPEPELNFGLELLAHGSGRILVAVAAGKRVMSRIGRTFGMETHDLRYHHYDWMVAEATTPPSTYATTLIARSLGGLGADGDIFQYHSAVKPCVTAKPEPPHDRAIWPLKIARRTPSHCGDLG